MFSYLKSVFSYYFTHYDNDEEDNDLERDQYLAEQLVDLEANNSQFVTEQESSNTIPRDAICFQRTGVVTLKSNDDYILIDGILYFELSKNSINVQVNDKIQYLAYTNESDKVVVVRILENQGLCWGDEETTEETSFKVRLHVIVGEVESRQDRYVYIKDSDLKFNLDNVESTIVPIKGDWLELNCKIQWDENKPSDISAAQVLQVISLRPLRSKIQQAVITAWYGDYGTCDKNIYFDKQCLENGIVPHIGSKVMLQIIESNQGICTWRAVQLIIIEDKVQTSKSTTIVSDEEEKSICIEKERNIEITSPLKFDNINIKNSAEMKLNVTNNGNEVQFINKWIILSKKKDSQVIIDPFLNHPKKLFPGETFTFTIKCIPKFLGSTRETLIIMLKGFQAKRSIDINIISESLSLKEKNKNGTNGIIVTNKDKIETMRNIRNNVNQGFIPGVKLNKPPAFVAVKLGMFTIPEKIWSVVLGDSEQTSHSSDFQKIIFNIEERLPCLTQAFNINNYTDKWHTLLYMEEIQNNLNMRKYDKQKEFLIRCDGYLGIEISDLAEQRPSIIMGDRVVVKDTWDPTTPFYEGFIHEIKGDLVLIKFNQRFHEIYSGSDVSIEFHSSRTAYRRAHQAINLALSNLGHNILFPSRITIQPKQLSHEKIEGINWFNTTLNPGQKRAVINILLGECRPLPYFIFGPPGTGKTVTVIEAILQILTTLPESRLLVATPSNSAANLITERLLEYRDKFSDSMVRIVGYHFSDSDKIPEKIRPFCATLDIALEDTSKDKHRVKNGINLNCRRSFIGRHRVTIGTCYCIGSLAQLGLPKGHFTHVIVDEAGQATEPEIMIPLTFIDKANGQIVLAGDPMQLGPVIVSKYCMEFGMDESYISRILKTFPYQKDYAAFKHGYDNRLITKLTENYRSLSEVIQLPSEMFYDSSLETKLSREEPWIQSILMIVNEIFDRSDCSTGGIYTYGIIGSNKKSQESPSWYNAQEASMVALTTCKLYKKMITPDDIGIITPYVAQIKYLRLVFDAMGLPQPKIGTVEDFQGQERRIILVSTVRSTEMHLGHDYKFTLGFVQNPKRLNVALTRAQVAVLLFCNPHLLCKDVLWKKVVADAVKNDKYMGCNLPDDLSK